jgi:hypothetical protein
MERPSSSLGGDPVVGRLRSSGAVYVPNPNVPGGQVLDSWGGVHPFGGAPPVLVTAYWGSWDIARQLVLRADGHSGYTLDGWGGVHAFGTAASATTSTFYHGSDVPRGVRLSTAGGGYVVFQSGALAPFGTAPIANVGPMALPLARAIG